MSFTNITTSVETTHPNAATIQGLREAADWLEQHPELPKAHWAAISFRSAYISENAREELTALAQALGDCAEERKGPGSGEASIEGHFGPVRVSATAWIQHLRDEAPPVLEYEPIIKVGEHR